jgi:hypothetical protein
MEAVLGEMSRSGENMPLMAFRREFPYCIGYATGVPCCQVLKGQAPHVAAVRNVDSDFFLRMAIVQGCRRPHRDVSKAFPGGSSGLPTDHLQRFAGWRKGIVAETEM